MSRITPFVKPAAYGGPPLAGRGNDQIKVEWALEKPSEL